MVYTGNYTETNLLKCNKRFPSRIPTVPNILRVYTTLQNKISFSKIYFSVSLYQLWLCRKQNSSYSACACPISNKILCKNVFKFRLWYRYTVWCLSQLNICTKLKWFEILCSFSWYRIKKSLNLQFLRNRITFKIIIILICNLQAVWPPPLYVRITLTINL